uniref:Retrotransposon gag domain-containing protein n=1 Tax=Kalanchoe fedtschenkoi TaxID=63787 RepID=A0A7N0RGP3_KALFE
MPLSPEHSSSSTPCPTQRTSKLRRLRRRNIKLRRRRACSKRFTESEGFSKVSKSSKPTDPYSTAASDSDSDSDPGPTVRSSESEASSSCWSRSGSYINVAAYPVFRGRSGECPFKHLSRFGKVCCANGADLIEMMVRIFPVTLEDEAALWYDLNIEPYFHSLSWKNIKASFSEAYGKHQELAECELMLIFQKEDESVRSYMLRFQFLLRSGGNGLSDSALRSVFVEGLVEEIRSFVVGKKPESLDDALRLAFEFEKLMEIRAARKVLVDSRNARRNGVSTSSVEEIASELARCASIGASSLGLRGCAEEEEDVKQIGGGLHRKQQKKGNECRCSKHQCHKKRLERNNSSFASRRSYADD